MRYKTGQAARLAGISPTTARVYSRTFGYYFSSDASPSAGGTRFYTDDDVVILATIAQLRRDGRDDDEIAAALADGERLDMPGPETERDREEEEEPGLGSELVVRLTATVARFEGELSAVQDERDRLITKLDEANEARRQAEIEAAELRGRLDRRPWYRRLFGG